MPAHSGGLRQDGRRDAPAAGARMQDDRQPARDAGVDVPGQARPQHYSLPLRAEHDAEAGGLPLIPHQRTLSSVSALQAGMLEKSCLEPGMTVFEAGAGGYNAELMAIVIAPAWRQQLGASRYLCPAAGDPRLHPCDRLPAARRRPARARLDLLQVRTGSRRCRPHHTDGRARRRARAAALPRRPSPGDHRAR